MFFKVERFTSTLAARRCSLNVKNIAWQKRRTKEVKYVQQNATIKTAGNQQTPVKHRCMKCKTSTLRHLTVMIRYQALTQVARRVQYSYVCQLIKSAQ